MNIDAATGWLGEYEIHIIGPNGTEVHKIKNLITDGALNLIRDALDGTVTDLTLKYLALGTDDGTTLPLANTNTKLGAEAFRKAFTKQAVQGTGVLESTVYIAPTEANVNIREIGIFAGANATTTADSGILVSRVFWTKDKTNLESINIVRTDTIGRV
jgi:hypothetical protein